MPAKQNEKSFFISSFLCIFQWLWVTDKSSLFKWAHTHFCLQIHFVFSTKPHLIPSAPLFYSTFKWISSFLSITIIIPPKKTRNLWTQETHSGGDLRHSRADDSDNPSSNTIPGSQDLNDIISKFDFTSSATEPAPIPSLSNYDTFPWICSNRFLLLPFLFILLEYRLGYSLAAQCIYYNTK